jgi:hypothetical protein
VTFLSENVIIEGFQQNAVSTVPAAESPREQLLWEFADIGFDTGKKLWFLQLFDSVNQNVGFYTAKSITINGGCGIQYEWKDMQGRPFWHVRERFLASEVEGFQIDVKGNLFINFKHGYNIRHNDDVPGDYAYLLYAYHLTTKETVQSYDQAPLGFVEFCDKDGEIISRLNNKWIVVEDVKRKTVGELPKIRIRVDREEIARLIATRSTIVIVGKDRQPG